MGRMLIVSLCLSWTLVCADDWRKLLTTTATQTVTVKVDIRWNIRNSSRSWCLRLSFRPAPKSETHGILSSRHNIVPSFRFSLYSLFSLLFRFEECHNIQPCEETSMPLTEPDLWISHIRLFSKAHKTGYIAHFDIRSDSSALVSPYQCTANALSLLCTLLLTPSSAPTRRDSSGITPTTPLL